jgi:iron complex transport system permease protein
LLGGFDGTSWPARVAAPLISADSVLLRAGRSTGSLLGEEVAYLVTSVAGDPAGPGLARDRAGVGRRPLGCGLVVPHLVRLLVGPNARLVLPISALFGASLLASADIVARMLGGVPVGVVTAVIGAPFFLALLRRARTGYEL